MVLMLVKVFNFRQTIPSKLHLRYRLSLLAPFRLFTASVSYTYL